VPVPVTLKRRGFQNTLQIWSTTTASLGDDLAMLANEIATVSDRIKAGDPQGYFHEVKRALTKAMAEIDLVQK